MDLSEDLATFMLCLSSRSWRHRSCRC